MPQSNSGPELEAILRTLNRLEERLSRLEAQAGLATPGPETGPLQDDARPGFAAGIEETGLELRIGEFGLAWAGGIVFLLGIVFLMTYTLNQGHILLSTLIGYSAGIGLYLLARAWEKGFRYLSRLLVCASLLLSYYTTMRLHYFTAVPPIENRAAAFVLLLPFATLPLVLALVRKSQVLAALAVTLGLVSALLADSVHVSLALVALVAALAVTLALSRGWWRTLNLTIVLCFLTHLLWLVGNPLAGHALRAVASSRYNLAYLLLCAGIFAWPTFFFDDEAHLDAAKVGAVFLNCLGLSAIVALAAFAVFPKSFAVAFLAAGGVLLAASVVQWLRTHTHFASAAYACFGFLSLSIAIYGFAEVPEAFLWLALQSFLVVSMALWYRSKTLVVANATIYLGILLLYWLTSPLSDMVNFAFALVALASARVMNWKKQRLTLRTDGLRNVYLAITFVLVLYSLYHAVPGSYIALSWTATAVGYFLLSLLLKNVKYRWMSLLNLLATVMYLFLVDLPNLDPKFRVVAFLILGLMAVAISLFYTRLRHPARKGEN